MCHTGSNAHQYRRTHLFRKVVCIRHHVVSFLLGRRFQNRNQGKLAVKTGILLILRRMHRRIIGSQYHYPSVHACNGRIDKCVCTYVHSHVFHADQGAFSYIRNTQCSLHGCFFIGAPAAVQTTFFCYRRVLNIFRNFSRGSSRISIHSRNPRVNGSQRNGLVAQQ